MDVYDELKIYFDRYIKNYLPYKSNRVFQALAAVLKNNFLLDAYKEIPYDLSYLVEKQKITLDLYDKLLLGNGYPYKIIRTFSIKDKTLLLNHLMHYQNDQGDLNHFQQIAELFDDKFNIFELYGDYRIINEENTDRLDYVMAGKPIYKCNDEPDPIYDYDEIYNETPTYFVSRQQLNYWRLTKSLVLPFKTNLLSLEWQNISQYSFMDSIVCTNVYSYFQHQKIVASVNERAYNISIGDLYQLYHYIIFYVDGKTYQNDGIFQNISIDVRPTPVFPLEENVPNNLDEYIETANSVHDADSYHDYYKNKVSSNYSTYLSGNMLSLDDIRTKLLFKIDPSLVKYLESVIDNAIDNMTGLYDVVSILENILDEFIQISTDPNAKKYEKWLKLFLSKPTIDPKKTTTYKLLYQFKPYHTQFILRAKYKLKYEYDNCWIRDNVFYVIHNYEHSAVVLSDYYTLKTYKYGKFCLTNNDESMSGECKKLAGIKVGDIVEFVDSKDNPKIDCGIRQVIDIDKENINISESQYNQILNLFQDNDFKRQNIEEVYNTVISNKDEDFLKALNKQKDISKLKLRIALNPIFDLCNNPDVLVKYDTVLTLIYVASITDDVRTEYINNLNNDKIPYHLVDKTILLDTIDSYKNELLNAFKDIKIKIELLPEYSKSNGICYDLNSLNSIIDNSMLPDVLKFKFHVLQLISSFPNNGDSTIKPFLNYIQLVFNKDVKLGSGNIILSNDAPYNISITQSKNNITFDFGQKIKKNSGKLVLQPKQNYIIDVNYNEPILNLNFSKNIILGNGEIKLEPELKYITKTNTFQQYSAVLSEFNTFINCLETTIPSLQVFENYYILFEQFVKVFDNKLQNYIPNTSYINNFYTYWNQFHNLPDDSSLIYDFVDYYILQKSLDKTIMNMMFTDEDISNIQEILSDDDFCNVLFDRPWTCETKCYDTMIVSNLPPVLETLTIPDALFTFNNIESAKYVHTNEIGFRSIYIGDYIWVVQDTRKYAVKVVGKDLNALNLKIDKYYQGTAGTFYTVGRYRSGF